MITELSHAEFVEKASTIPKKIINVRSRHQDK